MTLPRLLLLSVCALLVAQVPLSETRAEDEAQAAPLTSYEAGPLRRATLVVVGTTRSVRTQRQQQLAQVEVSSVLLGKPPTRPLTVMVRGPHPSSDLRDRESTGFPARGTGRHVYFLSTRERGLACIFRDAFAADATTGDAKIAALREEIRLAGIEDAEQRAKETRTYLLGGLVSKTRWTRAHAARELLRFAKARRDLIDEGLERKLRDRVRRPLPREERAWLEAVVKHLAKTPRKAQPRKKTPQPSAGADPWQLAWEQASEKRRAELVDDLLVEPGPRELKRAWWALGASEPATRRLILRRLTDLDRTSLLPQMLRRYATEEDPSVRAEILRATGLLGDDTNVPWLAERALNPRLERAALLALARIRSTAAKDALRAARRRIESEGETGTKRRVAWIDYLLSEAFEKSTLMR